VLSSLVYAAGLYSLTNARHLLAFIDRLKHRGGIERPLTE
jgi:hypothetical protein